MKKSWITRITAVIMAGVLGLGMVPSNAFAAEEGLASPTAEVEPVDSSPSSGTERDIDEETYKELGLNVTDYNVNNTFDAPYGLNSDAPTHLFGSNEIYVQANGGKLNGAKYVLRDGFDRMDDMNWSAHVSSDQGKMYGAYQ